LSEYRDNDFRAFLRSARAGMRLSLVNRLIGFIDRTESSLDCAIYDLRHPEILAALRRVVDRGQKVRLLYDAGRAKTGAVAADPKPAGTAKPIATAGLSAQAIAFVEHGHLMHDKFLIRDGDSVWTGSANFTVGGLELFGPARLRHSLGDRQFEVCDEV
jgi:phosphatidylserine/phosphatidylglycerophosphate/cardiolipin synthase-like enzyme